MQLDALIAGHDLVETLMLKDRVDAQNARGDDVEGWLAEQQYDAEDSFQRIEAEFCRKESAAIQALIDARRQDKKTMSEHRQIYADACKSMLNGQLSSKDEWHAAGGEHPVSPWRWWRASSTCSYAMGGNPWIP